MTSGSGLKLDDQHLPVLDGLRGLAAYIVVLSHVSNATNLGSGLLGQGAGQIGVMLFFVLSGFLMGALYLGRPFNRQNAWRFVVRRFARVIPLYYAVITVALIFVVLSQWVLRDFTIYPLGARDLIYQYGLVSGENVFWTVPVEIHFYVAFLGIWWLRNNSRILFWLFIGPAILWFFVGPANEKLMPQFLGYVGYFLAGLLISRVIGNLRPGRFWSPAFIGAIAASLLLFPTIYARVFWQARWPDIASMWHDPFCLIAVSALLVTSCFAPLAKTVLANRFMVHSGRISYSVYLIHVPVIIWLTRFTSTNQNALLFLFLTFVVTIAIASLSYRWFESPSRAAIVAVLTSPAALRRRAAI